MCLTEIELVEVLIFKCWKNLQHVSPEKSLILSECCLIFCSFSNVILVCFVLQGIFGVLSLCAYF